MFIIITHSFIHSFIHSFYSMGGSRSKTKTTYTDDKKI